MLTGHGERSRVVEAVRLGVHEFLLKPVSCNALLARIVSVLAKPRPMVRRGDYYGPEPRKLVDLQARSDDHRYRAGWREAPGRQRRCRGQSGQRHMIFVNVAAPCAPG